MAAADDGGPQPTAHDHEVLPGCSLEVNRRTFVKSSAALAAIAAGGAASSGTALGAEGIVDGVVSAVPGSSTTEKYLYGSAAAAMGPGGLMGLVAIDKLEDELSSDPSADFTILHNLATAEYEDLTAHEATFGNRLTDAKTVASLEARHGIAQAWEAGESSSTAYNNAMSRIRQYYELPEFNHWHVTCKSLLQLGYVGDAANANGDDAFVAGIGTDGSGNSIQFRFRGSTTTVDLTLYDGTKTSNVNADEADQVSRSDGSTTLKVPEVHLRDTTNGTDLEKVPVIDQDVVDSWDSANETLTYTTSGGKTITFDGSYVVPNVNDLESSRVWKPAETFHILDDIKSASDTVTGNYSQSFVEDLYAELDAGNVTPTQVRSPEGVAHFLSGTDDRTNGRFRVAMLQQLGMAQPDFSRVASMSVNYSGATDEWVDPDPNLSRRNVYPSAFKTDQSYSGALFANETPSGGFQPEDKYLVGPTYYLTHGNGALAAVDQATGRIRWINNYASAVHGVAVSADGKTVFAGDGSGTVTAFNAADGSTKWTYSMTNRAAFIDVNEDTGEVIVAEENGGVVRSLDPSDGTELWQGDAPSNGARSMAIEQDNSTILTNDGGSIFALDATDGTQKWSLSHSTYVWCFASSPDNSTIYFGDGNGVVTAINASDQTEKWTLTTDSSGGYVNGLACSEDGETLFVAQDNSPHVSAYDLTNGQSQLWTTDLGNSAQTTLLPPGDSKLLVGADSNKANALDPATGDILWTSDGLGGSVNDASMMEPTQSVSGTSGAGLMFDEPSGDSINLRDGIVEIVKMTDRDGATVTHVTDQTIADIEALSGTPDSIDTVVSDMAEFDSVSDIKYKRDVESILSYYGVSATIGDQDGDDVTITPTDYSRPKYDSYNSTEWADYMAKNLEQYKEQLEAEQSSSSSSDEPLFGGLFSGSGGGLLGLGIIGAVLLMVFGAVTDLIPGIGN